MRHTFARARLASVLALCLVIFLSSRLLKSDGIDSSQLKPALSRVLTTSSQETANDPFRYEISAAGPRDPYAYKVMYGIKTGANYLWEQLPVHMSTTYLRWPHHMAYAEVSTSVGTEPVVNVFERVPEHVLNDSSLAGYLALQTSIEEYYNWNYDDVADYDGWEIARLKELPMLAHMWETAPKDIEWFVFADGDTYFMQEGLIDHLKQYDPNEPRILGSPAFLPIKSGTNQYNIVFPHGGSGTAVSRGAVAKLFAEGTQPVIDKYTELALSHCCGDAIFAAAMYEVTNTTLTVPWGLRPHFRDPYQGANFVDLGIVDDGWCQPVYSWHHLKPKDIQTLWEFEGELNGPITYSQVYRHFWLPYMVPERKGWDAFYSITGTPTERVANNRWLFDFSKESIKNYSHLNSTIFKETLVPYRTKEECANTCMNMRDCLVWRWMPGHCTTTNKLLVRGQAITPEHWDWKQDMWSGWIVDRIQDRRKGAECDPLGPNDLGDEGWAWRHDTHSIK